MSLGIIWKSHLQAYSNKPLELTDVFVKNGTTQVDIDPQQDCKDFQFAINNGTLKWSFRRKFVTCDEKHDYPLEVLHIISKHVSLNIHTYVLIRILYYIISLKVS